MSPFNILISSGNSSNDVDLNFLPNEVSLTSSGNRFPSLSFSSVIVLNLYNLNIFSFLPGLSCVNKTGDPNFILTRIAVIIIIGDKTIIANNAHKKSCGLFINLLYIIQNIL